MVTSNKNLKELQFTLEKSNKYPKTVLIDSGNYPEMSYEDLLRHIIVKLISKDGKVFVSKVIDTFINMVTDINSDAAHLFTTESNSILQIKTIFPKITEYGYSVSKNKRFKTPLMMHNKLISENNTINVDLPLIIPPKNWVLSEDSHNAYYGGYYSVNTKFDPLVSVNRRLKNQPVVSNRLVELINDMQQQKIYAISIMEPTESHSVRLHNIQESIRHLKADVPTTTLKKLQSDSMNTELILNAYTSFKEFVLNNKVDYIYLVIKADFRGRLTGSTLINPTADKFFRASLVTSCNNKKCKEFDAVASILQVLGMLTLNIKLLKATNLIPSDSIQDPWTDIYRNLINPVINDQFKADINKKIRRFQSETQVNFKPVMFDDIIIDGKHSIELFTRNFIKFATMRMSYNSNAWAISKSYLAETQINISPAHVIIVLAEFYDNFPFEYKTLQIIPKLNDIYTGTLGHGIKVDNRFISFDNTYLVDEKYDVEFYDHNGKRRVVEKYKRGSDINYSKSAMASNANLFHSVDSGACCTTIRKFLDCKKFIYTIHDAFVINEEDESFLKLTYNEALLSYHKQLINIFQKAIDMFGPHSEDMLSIIKINDELKFRLIEFEKYKTQIVNSTGSLKKS